ncbi:MAG: DNA recombination protein RmuC [Alphaproteobacteria bacterium]|nr:DNA recombination protein RmuC [Alphaproteobacteria bacterium]
MDDPVPLLLAAALALAVIAVAVLYTRLCARAAEAADLRLRLGEVERLAAEGRERMTGALADKAAAETREAATREGADRAGHQLAEAIDQRERAQLRANQADTERARAEEQRQAMEKRLADWETVRLQALDGAKAATLAAATELSNKLLADHKRENEAAKKEAEERVKETTEALAQRFESVTQKVASLHDVVSANQQTVDTVWNALSNPGGAGYFAEIGLENTLKSFGLAAGRDFVMQYTVQNEVDGRRLRPDAVVFLPSDSVLVIDSKASKFVLELAAADDDEEKAAELRAAFAATMNGHLRALAAKDYRAAIVASYREAGRSAEIRRILSVMYVPNEGALETLRAVDPEFDRKAAAAAIIPIGPAGLAGLVGFARIDIDYGRQLENQERIVAETRALLDQIGLVLGHAEKLGRNLRLTAEGFVAFAGSVNRRLLPRTRKLEALGVRPAKALPTQIAAHQIVEVGTTIEAEAEDVTGEPAAPRALADRS